MNYTERNRDPVREGGFTVLAHRMPGAHRMFGMRIGLLSIAVALTMALAACGSDKQGTEGHRQASVDRAVQLALSVDSGAVELSDVASAEPEAPEPEPTPTATRRSAPTTRQTAPPAPEPERSSPAAASPAPPQPQPQPQPQTPAEPAPEPEPAATAATAATAAPAGAEGAARAPVRVPRGTSFKVTLDQQLTSRWSRPGTVFTATLTEPITDGERVLVPAGTKLRGRVSEVIPPRKNQPGEIKLTFNEINVDGDRYPIYATVTQTESEEQVSEGSTGPSTGSRVGQGALSGAVLGSVIGRNTKGTLIGAVAGGLLGGLGGGSGAVNDLVLAAGSQVSCVLGQPLVIQPISNGT